MTYSDSMHFSDKNSYKIPFVSSYGLKDMNYARFAGVLEKEKLAGTFLTEAHLASDADGRVGVADRMLSRPGGAELD
jgi:hypothetical protein